MPCVNKVLQLIINLMTYNINFNKIAFIDWSKVFIILKHVFYNLSYATIMSNMIKEIIKNVFSN
jgi:uncharacterized membrane protein YadS